NPNGARCGKPATDGINLFYDSTTTQSQFAATITPSPAVAVYLHGNGTGCPSSTTSRSLSETAPTAATAQCSAVGGFAFGGGNAWNAFGTWSLPAQCDCDNQFIPEVRKNPPAPAPEAVAVSELPLPPTAPSTTAGSCDLSVN